MQGEGPEGVGEEGGVAARWSRTTAAVSVLSCLRRLPLLLRNVRQFADAEWLQRRSDDDVDELL